MHVTSFSTSHTGKVRTRNEDAVSADDKGLWFVADGMGGHACGDLASQIAKQTIVLGMENKTSLQTAIELAHANILKEGQQDETKKGMGTTIVAASAEGNKFRIAWVGDSRAYAFQKNLEQLTLDHTFVQDMVFREVLTKSEAANHPQNNLLNRSLGMLGKKLTVEQLLFRPTQNGYVLLCSDGISDYLTDEQISACFLNAENEQAVAETLKKTVLETEAGDNFSFVIIHYKLPFFAKGLNKLRANMWRN